MFKNLAQEVRSQTDCSLSNLLNCPSAIMDTVQAGLVDAAEGASNSTQARATEFVSAPARSCYAYPGQPMHAEKASISAQGNPCLWNGFYIST